MRIDFEMPADLDPRIVYPMAMLANSAHQAEAMKFLDFLKSDDAAQVFRRFGFGLAQ